MEFKGGEAFFYTSSNLYQVYLGGFVKLKIEGIVRIKFFLNWCLISFYS